MIDLPTHGHVAVAEQDMVEEGALFLAVLVDGQDDEEGEEADDERQDDGDVGPAVADAAPDPVRSDGAHARAFYKGRIVPKIPTTQRSVPTLSKLRRRAMNVRLP